MENSNDNESFNQNHLNDEKTQLNKGGNLIEDLFEKQKYGKYQYIALLMTFLSIFIEGIHLTLMSCMIIPLKSYFAVKDNFGIEVASAFIFIGVALGSLSIGFLTKKLGREVTAKLSYILICFAQLATVFANSIILFTIMRLFIGYGVGIIVPISLNILLEYLPIKLRSFILTAIWASFSIGQCSTLAFMLIFMPNYEITQIQTIQILLWVLVLIFTIIFLLIFVDSPRNLILTGKIKEGLKILKYIGLSCNVDISASQEDDIVEYIKKGGNKDYANNSLGSLFQKNTRNTTIILIITWTASSMLLYGPLLIYSPTLKDLNITSDSNIILSLFIGTLIGIVVLSTLPILSEYLFGMKNFSIICYYISGVLSILIIIFTNIIYIWYALYSYFLSTAFNLNTTYTTHIYPTKIRDTAVGFFYFCTRIGGFISQFLFLWLYGYNIMIPYYLIVVLCLLCGTIKLFLKIDPSGESLDKHYDE